MLRLMVEIRSAMKSSTMTRNLYKIQLANFLIDKFDLCIKN